MAVSNPHAHQAPLLCPLCREKLAAPVALQPSDSNSLRCTQGHHFDRARQGYVNLLPAQFKRSKDPGDSKAMVQARRQFLEAGYYAPIANGLIELILGRSTPDLGLTVLDAGCGEGYYVRQMAHALPQHSVLLGNDVSKWAVQAAASSDKTAQYVVASNARLPYADSSIDVVVCAFGFTAPAEFNRVLKPTGVLITVDPLPGHLDALRDVLYDERKEKVGLTSTQLEGFVLQQQTQLQFTLQLEQPMLHNLVEMTPHAHRAPAQGKQRLALLDSLQLSAEVMFQLWQPAPQGI